MRIQEDEELVIFKFSPLHTLKIHKKDGFVEWEGRRISFQDIIGYWKNFRRVRRKNVYYVMLLTSKSMAPITPHLDEYDADEVLRYLRKIIPREVKK